VRLAGSAHQYTTFFRQEDPAAGGVGLGLGNGAAEGEGLVAGDGEGEGTGEGGRTGDGDGDDDGGGDGEGDDEVQLGLQVVALGQLQYLNTGSKIRPGGQAVTLAAPLKHLTKVAQEASKGLA
jgi:hypothetical protein